MKTTKKDFNFFVECHKKWCDKLGVKEWSIHYDHDDTRGAYAKTYWKLSEAVSTVVLGHEWNDLRKKTNDEIDKLALHECLHLVLAPLVAEAESRYTYEDMILQAEHAIIRRLENIICALD